MKRRISAYIRWARFIFVALATGFLWDLITIIMYYHPQELDRLIGEGVFLIICCLFVYIFNRAKTVEFDDTNMYVTGYRTEENVPLKNVTKIKLTMTEINHRHLWKIVYNDVFGVEKVVRILPKYFSTDFSEFTDYVQAINKKAEVVNWSYTFDIDQ